MQFKYRKNPSVYLAETHEYVTDLGRITLLRDKCTNETEKASYDNLIHVMQEVLLFMNTMYEKDKRQIV